MVPVGMGKEQVQAPARFGQIGLHQIETQNANTGTGIDDDARALMLDKAAGGVAAKFIKLCPTDGQRTPHSVIFYFQ